ncbi:MAG: hypothetical protein KF812_12255 [Fimbriimonadaceae bacterium]|nr:hypothetical protein [Fimbriimonadaceae bacterium]
MSERVVAVLGAGNFVVTAPALATLASYLDAPLRIALFDPHEERLDLAHLFLRVCIEESGTGHQAVADSQPAMALQNIDAVIWTLEEDSARRLRGIKPHFAATDELEPTSVFELVRGDPNRPTPPDQLSQRTKSVLGVPVDQGSSAAEAMKFAVESLLPLIPTDVPMASLMRGCPLPEGVAYTQLNWPAPIASELQAGVPHQVLRWARETEPVYDLLREARTNLLSEWLDSALLGR